MKDENNKDLFWKTTKTALLFGSLRGLISTPLIEVPLTNIQRRRQTFIHIHKDTPPLGTTIFLKLLREGKFHELQTGLGPNIAKNFSRELLRAYSWLGVPILMNSTFSPKVLDQNPKMVIIASVAAVVAVNGTMNTIYDGVRNKQIDTFNITGKKLNSFQALSKILDEHGSMGVFHGGKMTYFYSAYFWGGFAVSRESYSYLAKKCGFNISDLKTQTAINILSGINSGIMTMPVEHLRFQILSGDLPPEPLKALQKFKEIHGAKTWPRLFCGLSQSLPTQISASLLAGTLLYWQKQNEHAR